MSGSFHVRAKNISKHYGTHHVFDDICLCCSGEVMGIGGSNGSGKSTLLKCLAGLEAINAGSIAWECAKEPMKTNRVKKYLGYAAPYINLYDQFSCAENLQFLMRLRNTPDEQQVQHWLNRVGLQAVKDQSYNRLSTGQKQRLRLAAACVHQPDILFLDEPGSNLDEAGRALIKQLIADFKASSKMVFIASNNPVELTLCDQVFSVETECFL